MDQNIQEARDKYDVRIEDRPEHIKSSWPQGKHAWQWSVASKQKVRSQLVLVLRQLDAHSDLLELGHWYFQCK